MLSYNLPNVETPTKNTRKNIMRWERNCFLQDLFCGGNFDAEGSREFAALLRWSPLNDMICCITTHIIDEQANDMS